MINNNGRFLEDEGLVARLRCSCLQIVLTFFKPAGSTLTNSRSSRSHPQRIYSAGPVMRETTFLLPMHVNVGRLCVYEMRTLFRTSGNCINSIRREKCVTFRSPEDTQKFAKAVNMSGWILGKWAMQLISIWTMTHFLFLAFGCIQHIGCEMKPLSALRLWGCSHAYWVISVGPASPSFFSYLLPPISGQHGRTMTGLRLLHDSSGVVVKTLKLRLKVSAVTTWSLFHFISILCAGGSSQNNPKMLQGCKE